MNILNYNYIENLSLNDTDNQWITHWRLRINSKNRIITIRFTLTFQTVKKTIFYQIMFCDDNYWGARSNNLGVYLPQPVFSNGQLYVALSRAGIPHKTKVMIINIKDTEGSFENYDGKFTNNNVCIEIFQ